jgi:acetyltransferase-like isoleucine patch superfamily enzyme
MRIYLCAKIIFKFMKAIAALVICLLPFNWLRIFLYRFILRYDISYRSKVNAFNYIKVDHVRIANNAGIRGYFNVFSKVKKVILEEGSSVKGNFNSFKNFNLCHLKENAIVLSKSKVFGTSFSFSPFKKLENLVVGSNSTITSEHVFDVSDQIIVGNNVTIGGLGSQFWTHGFNILNEKVQGPIHIGDNCYIGSRSILLPGIKVANSVSIGAGTTVSINCEREGVYVSSQMKYLGAHKSADYVDTIIREGNVFHRK